MRAAGENTSSVDLNLKHRLNPGSSPCLWHRNSVYFQSKTHSLATEMLAICSLFSIIQSREHKQMRDGVGVKEDEK